MPPKMPAGNFSAVKRTLASKYREAKSQVSQQNPFDDDIEVPKDQDMAMWNESDEGLGGFGGFYGTGGSNVDDSEDAGDDFEAADQDIIGVTVSLPN
jgi:hypothetical protein